MRLFITLRFSLASSPLYSIIQKYINTKTVVAWAPSGNILRTVHFKDRFDTCIFADK